jgi:hypothetical protein
MRIHAAGAEARDEVGQVARGEVRPFFRVAGFRAGEEAALAGVATPKKRARISGRTRLATSAMLARSEAASRSRGSFMASKEWASR